MSYLVRDYGDTDFITGLRFVAATMVVMIHTAAMRDLGWLGDIITDNGKYGVQIFFVISGFTIARTYRAAHGFGAFFGRRLMRIVPLYYAVIIPCFLLILFEVLPRPYWMTLYDGAPDTYDLIMHLTFLSAWDARVANSLVGVEWSIPIEVFWYAVLPLLLPVPGSRRRIALILAGLLALSALSRIAGHTILPQHGAHYLPLTYGAYFYLGALAERLRPTVQDRPLGWRRRAALAAGALFALGLVTDTGFNAAILALATAGLIIARPGADGPRGVLCLRPVLFLGSISYSLYLLHLPAALLIARVPAFDGLGAGLAYFLLVMALTTAMSVISYTLIEYPSNRLGRLWFGSQRPSAPPKPQKGAAP